MRDPGVSLAACDHCKVARFFNLEIIFGAAGGRPFEFARDIHVRLQYLCADLFHAHSIVMVPRAQCKV